MTNHTPGPWSTTNDARVSGNRDQWSKLLNCMAPEFVASVGGCDRETAVANACLIAAAPELLEALKHAHTSLRTFSDHVPDDEKGWTSYDSEVLTSLEDAIAKAEPH